MLITKATPQEASAEFFRELNLFKKRVFALLKKGVAMNSTNYS